MIVVDANVIAYRFIEGEKTALACKVQQKDTGWVVPLLWRHEFLNVLATTVRAGIIDTLGACLIWRDAVRVLENREKAVHYESALACAAEHSVSAYDAQYITLAKMLNCRCVTEDTRLCKAFPETALPMRAFLLLKT